MATVRGLKLVCVAMWRSNSLSGAERSCLACRVRLAERLSAVNINIVKHFFV